MALINFEKQTISISGDSDVDMIIITMMGGLPVALSYMDPPASYLRNNTDLVDWDVISSSCSASIAAEFPQYINWVAVVARYDESVWLDTLDRVREHLPDDLYKYVWPHRDKIYTQAFMMRLPQLVDWKWAMVNMQLSSDVLVAVFPTIMEDINVVTLMCKHQSVPEAILDKYPRYIVWTEISKRPGLHISHIRKYLHMLNLDLLFTHQKLPIDIIDMYKFSVFNGSTIIPKYQILDDDHIVSNCRFYAMETIFETQKISLSLVARLARHINVIKYVLYSPDLDCVVVDRWQTIIILEHDVISESCQSDTVRKVLYLDSRSGKIRELSHHNE